MKIANNASNLLLSEVQLTKSLYKFAADITKYQALKDNIKV